MNMIKVCCATIILVLFFSVNAHSGGEIETSRFQPIKVTLLNLHDPGYVTLGVDNGETIDTVYDDIEWKVLSEWLDEQEKTGVQRAMHMRYNEIEGVLISDEESGAVFKLVGEIKNNHPIDLEIEKCRDKAVSTLDYADCNYLALNLWRSELRRVFYSLGAENANLEQDWDQYFDAKTAFLSSWYGKREGSIWGLTFQGHKIDLIRQEVNFFGRLREW